MSSILLETADSTRHQLPDNRDVVYVMEMEIRKFILLMYGCSLSSYPNLMLVKYEKTCSLQTTN